MVNDWMDQFQSIFKCLINHPLSWTVSMSTRNASLTVPVRPKKTLDGARSVVLIQQQSESMHRNEKWERNFSERMCEYDEIKSELGAEL